MNVLYLIAVSSKLIELGGYGFGGLYDLLYFYFFILVFTDLLSAFALSLAEFTTTDVFSILFALVSC
jgi:hypothetical protein